MYLLNLLILSVFLLTGCAPSKYDYLNNPYENPVVQRSYSRWIMNENQEWARVESEKRKARHISGGQVEGYDNFIVQFNERVEKIEEKKRREKEELLTSFCQASNSCDTFFADQATK